MNKDTTAIETNASTIAPKEVGEKIVPTTEYDPEAKIQALEAEKSRLIEEASNYKQAYLKEKRKRNEEPEDLEEGDEDRLRRIARQELADSRLAEIAREQDAIIKDSLKKYKELRLSLANKVTSSPTSLGSHTEGQVVKDTLVTDEQINNFKQTRGWTDKDIERYKKHYQRNR